jgi:hypothetical protein
MVWTYGMVNDDDTSIRCIGAARYRRWAWGRERSECSRVYSGSPEALQPWPMGWRVASSVSGLCQRAVVCVTGVANSLMPSFNRLLAFISVRVNVI